MVIKVYFFDFKIKFLKIVGHILEFLFNIIIFLNIIIISADFYIFIYFLPLT